MKNHTLRPPSLARLLVVALFAAAGLSSAARAQIALDDLHVDLGVAYEDDALHLHWHDHDNELELAPSEAYGVLDAADFLPRPSGAQWDFIGASAGANVWLLPATQQAGQLFLGIGAEDIAPGVFDGNTITLRLVSVSGPGQVSVWSESLGSPVVRWATSDGLSVSDSIVLTAGGHNHYNWGFTGLGVYDLLIEATGTIGGVEVSDLATFTFAVGSAIPEPSSFALLGGAAALACVAARRRRRAA